MGGGTPLVVKFDHEETDKYIFDKTWQQVSDAYDAGLPIYLVKAGGHRLYLSLVNEFQAIFNDINSTTADPTELASDSPDGYLYSASIK